MTKETKNELINAAWLSDYEGTRKLVLIRLAYFVRLVENFADPSQITLARYCSCSERQVRYHLDALKADGVLDWKLVKQNGFHNRYTLSLEALAKRQSIAGKGLPGGNELPDADDALLPVAPGNGLPVGGGNGLPETVLVTESSRRKAINNGSGATTNDQSGKTETTTRSHLTCKQDRHTGDQNPEHGSYRWFQDEIIHHYPMKPLTPAIEKKWRDAIDLELDTLHGLVKTSGIPRLMALNREGCIGFFRAAAMDYASSNPTHKFTLENWLKNGVYQKYVLDAIERERAEEEQAASEEPIHCGARAFAQEMAFTPKERAELEERDENGKNYGDWMEEKQAELDKELCPKCETFMKHPNYQYCVDCLGSFPMAECDKPEPHEICLGCRTSPKAWGLNWCANCCRKMTQVGATV